MMYKCSCCGKVFEDWQIKKVREDRGEFWGFPAYETIEVSPCCGEDFEEWWGDEYEEA